MGPKGERAGLGIPVAEVVKEATATKNVVTDGLLRITHFDPCLMTEPSAAFLKTHSPFQRMPGASKADVSSIVEQFKAYAQPSRDVFVTFDAAQKKVVVSARMSCGMGCAGVEPSTRPPGVSCTMPEH